MLEDAWRMFIQILIDGSEVVDAVCDMMFAAFLWVWEQLILILGVCAFWEFFEGGYRLF